jgi:hypothetical protein
MFEIQYIQEGKIETIPIMYYEFEDAKKDANIFKPGIEKNIVHCKTKNILLNIPSYKGCANFIKF